MSRFRRYSQHDSDTSTSSESDGDVLRNSKCNQQKKQIAFGIGAGKFKRIWKKLSCKLGSVNVKLLGLSIVYATAILIFLAFLYTFGPLFFNLIGTFFRVIFRAILPSSFTKSTQDIVEEALAKYSADRLGMADYALESAGGSVICNSDTYYVKDGALYSMFGIPLWYHSSNPRAVIQPEVQPGKCWAMDGSQGYVTIQLAMPIVPTKVSLEHIPGEVATTGLTSAPKDFVIEGKEIDLNSPARVLGRFTYNLGEKPIQVFHLKESRCVMEAGEQAYKCGANSQLFYLINMRVLSNHGNEYYTCIYRLRVHGHTQGSLRHQDL